MAKIRKLKKGYSVFFKNRKPIKVNTLKDAKTLRKADAIITENKARKKRVLGK